jgi:hypothetical protein
VTIYAADYSVLKETDLLVVDGKGGSRLLSAIGWANIKEEVCLSLLILVLKGI